MAGLLFSPYLFRITMQFSNKGITWGAAVYCNVMKDKANIKNSVKIVLCIFLLLVIVQGVKAAETYQFVMKWGSNGSLNGQLYLPQGIAVDTSGNVYVADGFNARIQKFSSDGRFLAKFGSNGSLNGQFYYPEGVAVDSSGNIYVSDTDNGRIQKFSSTGTFLGKWGSWDYSVGWVNGTVDMPVGIATDTFGNVYVGDNCALYLPKCVQKFSSTGIFLGKWGAFGTGDGDFQVAMGVAVDRTGNVYASDYGNHRIQKFSSTGIFLGKWGTYGSGDGQFNCPVGVAVDASGNVYVVDMGNNRIQKFSSTGTFLTKWGSYGSVDGQFIRPLGVAVDSSGNVYVSDTENNRIQKFAPGQNAPAILMVDSSPQGVRVYIDTQYRGDTPIILTDLSAGIHQLKIFGIPGETCNPEYAINENVVLEAGKTVSISRTYKCPGFEVIFAVSGIIGAGLLFIKRRK